MPYVDQFTRKILDPQIMLTNSGMKPGEINYAITILLLDWLGENGGMNYTNLNTLVGVLECAKLELYRRMAAPYEDRKCAENGDVYPDVV